MVKIRFGKCKNKLKLSERGRARLLLLLRLKTSANCCFCDFGSLSSSPSPFNFLQDALETANFRGYRLCTQESLSCWNPDSIGFNLIEHVLCHIVKKERPGAVLVFMTGWDDINSLKDQLASHPILGDSSKVLLLACHGSMASSEQVTFFVNVFVYFEVTNK